MTTILHNFSILIGLVAVLIGSLAVLFPAKMSKGFGVATSGPALSYVISVGIRDVFIGATVLIMYFNSSWSSLGLVCWFIALVALSDFIVVFKNGDKKTSYVHLAGTLAAATYALALNAL